MTDNDVEYWRDRAHCAEQELTAANAALAVVTTDRDMIRNELAGARRNADHWRVAARQHRARAEGLLAKLDGRVRLR